MRIIKKFNENFMQNGSPMQITMDDVRKTKHNMDYDGQDSFLSNYGWDESTLIEVTEPTGTFQYDGKKVEIVELSTDDEPEFGYGIVINGTLSYIITIYEPHGYKFNEKRGCLTAHGHEEIIKVYLDDGEIETQYTR